MEQASTPPVSRRWPVALWGLTALALVCLSIAQDTLIAVVTGEYRHQEMKNLPPLTDLILRCRMALWLLPVAALASGLPFVWRADLEKTRTWTLVIILLTLVHAAVLCVAIIQPFMRVSWGLSR